MPASSPREFVYLGLGSNLGDREQNIALALALLSSSAVILRVSSLYQTAPVGYEEQPPFLNAVCCVATDLTPRALLRYVKSIERALGRRPSFPNAPRPVDIDILLYGRRRIATKALAVPHPRMWERAFVLVPLAEIAPRLRHPPSGRPLANIVPMLPDRSDVVKWAERQKALAGWRR
ncbi:MAG: 2-amino-4-hydroxy-6-hydroxymethyldihydropteridine diphosphokinase [Chloroflexi bacterium]|nr:2-amino-4-hydroxy-6-hydroxymethyldihydropteridine diphosphokinase [Chloroflexota bacterium]